MLAAGELTGFTRTPMRARMQRDKTDQPRCNLGHRLSQRFK